MEAEDIKLKIYSIVARIPEGKVVTYGQIAAAVGIPRGARMVGNAMSNAPEYLELPCHRVINSKGEMAKGLIFGGEENQRKRLKNEGVQFFKNGLVKLSISRWEMD